MELLDRFPWSLAIIAALTLGLAPFVPEPHIWEKMKMLSKGTLTRPVDIFDFFFHAIPFILIAAKAARVAMSGKGM